MDINIQNTENVGGYKTLIPTLNPQCECGNCNCNSNQTKTDDEFQEETYVNEEGRTVYRRKCASSKCGKIFETTNSLKKACSDECAHDVRNEQKRLYRERKRLNRKPIIKTCANCGKQFEATKKTQKYCDE